MRRLDQAHYRAPVFVQFRGHIEASSTDFVTQYVPNGIPLLFAGGGGGCHPLGLGLIEIGAHCPTMAGVERSRLARISTHLARSSGSHTNSGMPFSSV
jgi:hypothetical protein